MVPVRWLVWFLDAVKSWLSSVVAAQVEAVVAAQPSQAARTAADYTVVNTRAVAEALYAYVRAAAYLAWLAQVVFARHEAARHKTRLRYVPSMEGVSPEFVHTAVREELRVRGGRIEAPAGEVAGRLAARLGAVVPAIARRTGMHVCDDDRDTQVKSIVYSLEHGSPLGRLIATVYSDSPADTAVRGVFDTEPVAHRLMDMAVGEIAVEHDELTVTPDMLANIGVLKPGLSTEERDVIVRAWKAAAIAEIELTEDFPAYPNTWYYEWVQMRRTGRKQYIAPPKNAVFAWLVGELGAGNTAQYFTPEDYRARALEIVESLPVRWFEKKHVRWARIPIGSYTCAFCLLLASRGAVYHEAYTAQGFDHEHCDCLIVPVYDTENYPLKMVTDAAKKLYKEHKDLFQPKYSRYTYRAKDRHGNMATRHKKYVDIPASVLEQITADFPRVDDTAYKAWARQQTRKLYGSA